MTMIKIVSALLKINSMEMKKDLLTPSGNLEGEKKVGLGKEYEKRCTSLFNKLGEEEREGLLRIAQKI
jgi:hypothetical protein